uniref:Long neurotoxin 1 n=1 Tax=Hydrophis hardwickii TaxID=8781 RepID=3L21_HYDHA|nr:RecName: Full=Long neurotoxin 1; Flags: Precursor [Hydrophis hardwickii]AAL54892.1 long neurotoxin isoform [Hydrophis hardwickii]
MKILLLTLVVVTIVCLDLAYTRTCFRTPYKPETCPPGQNLCYKKSWCDAFCSSRGKVIELGCTAKCPTVKDGKDITCCATDNCNTVANWKSR